MCGLNKVLGFIGGVNKSEYKFYIEVVSILGSWWVYIGALLQVGECQVCVIIICSSLSP